MIYKGDKVMSEQEYIEQIKNLQEKVIAAKDGRTSYYKKITSNKQDLCFDIRLKLMAYRVKGKIDAYGEVLEMIHTILKPYEPTPEEVPMDTTGAESLDCFMK
jgi:hypothetical protein